MLLPQLPQKTYQKVSKAVKKTSKTLKSITHDKHLRKSGLDKQGIPKPALKSVSTVDAVDYEVLIIGAGVSGIDMACYLQQRYADNKPRQKNEQKHMADAANKQQPKPFLMVEKRADLGGTWDLFKYPGIRSDSDMFTFGFANKPWLSNKTLTDGASIKAYLKQTAMQSGVKQHICFNTEVVHLAWSSDDECWTATLKSTEVDDAKKSDEAKVRTVTARFVVGATGYYDYDNGYQPQFKGQEQFLGQIVHPQKWTDDINYHDKKVVVIGSGATAVTLVPALLNSDLLNSNLLNSDLNLTKAEGDVASTVADEPKAGAVNATSQKTAQVAAHVTMLQRSPTYIASVPSTDNGLRILTRYLPLDQQQAYTAVRWKNILFQQGLYRFSRVAPKTMKTILTLKAKHDLKGSGVPLKHFLPSYNPWDERLCAVPDADLFKVLHTPKAEVVTDNIDSFTKTGIQLKSGRHLDADIIITATGLKLQMLGGATVSIDGKPIEVGERMTYKAVLIEDVPNMAVMFGYTNASWTLKIDLACHYVLRLLKHMDSQGYQVVTPHATSSEGECAYAQADTVMGALSAGYIKRAQAVLPKQGDRYPWQVTNNYLTDTVMLKHRPIEDEWLAFKHS